MHFSGTAVPLDQDGYHPSALTSDLIERAVPSRLRWLQVLLERPPQRKTKPCGASRGSGVFDGLS
jgi:hypothetical protein